MVKLQLEDSDYQRLLGLRTNLRQFLRWSEQQAEAVGLKPSHHQLLLAIRGHDDPRGPTIGEVADYLLLRHHSAVELTQRVGALGLIRRVDDPDDGRVVRLRLTEKGTNALERLASLHLDELSRLASALRPFWQDQIAAGGLGGVGTGFDSPHPVRARRIYDEPSADDGARILVDRLWPRGSKREAASVD